MHSKKSSKKQNRSKIEDHYQFLQALPFETTTVDQEVKGEKGFGLEYVYSHENEGSQILVKAVYYLCNFLFLKNC